MEGTRMYCVIERNGRVHRTMEAFGVAKRPILWESRIGAETFAASQRKRFGVTYVGRVIECVIY